MNVKLLNPEEVKDLFVHWSEFSAVCYDTKIDPEKPDIIGKHCLESGHFSGSRGEYVKFFITDVPRDTVDQLVRHEVGVYKNVQSFRYVDKENMTVNIPSEIKDNPELVQMFKKHIEQTSELYGEIKEYVLEKTGDTERANEQARKVLMIHTNTAVTIGFTIEALINFCWKRLCTRTEEEHRLLAAIIRNTVVDILPELRTYLVPHCEYLLWCPEAKGCGRMPNRATVKQLVDYYNAYGWRC